jgi:hypothetical protein
VAAVNGGNVAGFETVEPFDVVPEPELENDPLAQPPSNINNAEAASQGNNTSTPARGILRLLPTLPSSPTAPSSIMVRFIRYSFPL